MALPKSRHKHAAYGTGTSRVQTCSAIMGEDETNSPPTAPIGPTYRRLQQRRGVIARLDNTAAAYWQTLVGDSVPYAEVALERAFKRYAKNGLPL